MAGHTGGAVALILGASLIAVSIGMYAGIVPQSTSGIPGISPQFLGVEAAFTWSLNGSKLTVTPANACPSMFAGCPSGIAGQAPPTLVSAFTWGDGTPSMSTTGSAPLIHSYQSVPTSGFSVVETFSVTQSSGSTVTATAYALVSPPPPGASFNSGTSAPGSPPTSAPVPGFSIQTNGLVVNVTDTTRYDGFGASSVTFAFGDGSAAARLSEPNTGTSHAYTRPGTYLIVETIAGTAPGSGGVVSYYNTSQPISVQGASLQNTTFVGPAPAQTQASTGQGFTAFVAVLLAVGILLLLVGALLWRRGI